jgi:hypothetical protein
LEKSLRADIENYINGRLSGLQEEVERLQSQLNEAFTRLRERMEGAAGGDASVAVTISEHLRNARNLGIEAAAAESGRARGSSDIALVKAAVDDLESQHTQADILNALVNRAAAFAPRVAFFVVKGERATGWRARGLAGTVGDDSVRELSLPLSSDTLLGQAAQARSTWSGEPGSHAGDHTIYNHFGGEPPQRLVAVPMVAREKVVAVLYADSAGQDADAVNLEALETLVRVAGMSVELLASRRASTAAPHVAAPAPAQEESQPEAAHTPASQPEPEAAHEPQPEPSVFDAEPQPEPEPEATPATPAMHEPEPPSFAPRAEPEPSFAATEAHARADSAPAPDSSAGATPVSPLAAPRRYGAMDMDFPVEVSEEDKRLHNEARRFARLLVSEIKLYNEQKVREGRDAGDLYDRLREDIDRSRQMYDKRVKPEVAVRYDYFHHELVHALAEGDPGKLGTGYPGASINA